MHTMTPVLLVTGFLGSGKTTFLNWLLKKMPDKPISLILNEFGDIHLETQFISKNKHTEVAELANGCMCCVGKSDIPRVIEFILKNAPQTEQIVIEASGLSDPEPIVDALRSDRLSSLVQLDTVLCIIDAENFEETRKEHSIVLSQVGDADIVLLSKIDQVDPSVVNRIETYIHKIGTKKSVLQWDSTLEASFFLEQTHVHEMSKNTEHVHEHAHEQYTEYWYTSSVAIDPSQFRIKMKALPPEVIRAKGFINAQGKKAMVQYVGGRLELSFSDWQGQQPTTTLLFLGKEIDTSKIKALLDAV